MMPDRPETVQCPSCGARVEASPIGTVCPACLGSLLREPADLAASAIPPPMDTPASRHRWSPRSRGARFETSWATAVALGVLLSLPAALALVTQPSSLGPRHLTVGFGMAAVLLILVCAKRLVSGRVYDVWVSGVPEEARLGEELDVAIAIQAGSPVRVDVAEAILQWREVATDITWQLAEERVHEVAGVNLLTSPEPLRIGRGATTTLPLRIAMPRAAPATLKSSKSSVEWEMVVRIREAGAFAPNVVRVPVRVTAVATGSPTPISPEEWGSLAPTPSVRGWRVEPGEPFGSVEHDGFRAQLCGSADSPWAGMAIARAGFTNELTVRLSTSRCVGAGAVRCGMGAAIRCEGLQGSENLPLVTDRLVHEGPLGPDHPVALVLTFALPERGPASVRGDLVRVEWVVRLTIEDAGEPVARLSVPMLVLPGSAEPLALREEPRHR